MGDMAWLICLELLDLMKKSLSSAGQSVVLNVDGAK